MSVILEPILVGTVVAATPLIYAAIGELVAERSGVLNLGVEGMLMMGAVSAFGVRVAGYPAAVAVLAAALIGGACAAVFALLTLSLRANQYVAGLALTIFGSGLSGFIGRKYGGLSIESIPHVRLGFLSELPIVGPVLFAQDPMVYSAVLLVAATAWVLYRSKAGLVIRAVGESPGAARAIGYPVIRIRYATTVFGGTTAGLAGAYLSLCYTPLWVEDMAAGRGWIALALVVFASWRPWRVLLGAWLFGGITVVQLFAQGLGVPLPSELLSALPYLATIVVLVVISRTSSRAGGIAPASLGESFQPDH